MAFHADSYTVTATFTLWLLFIHFYYLRQIKFIELHPEIMGIFLAPLVQSHGEALGAELAERITKKQVNAATVKTFVE